MDQEGARKKTARKSADKGEVVTLTTKSTRSVTKTTTYGAAGGSGRSKDETSASDKAAKTKDGPSCSKMSTLFEHAGRSYPLIRVKISDEEEIIHQREDKTWSGEFRVIDGSNWGYLIVNGRPECHSFEQGHNIEVSDVSYDGKHLVCKAQNVKLVETKVTMKDEVVEKMRQEEKFSTLKSICKPGNVGYLKIKVFIQKVGIKLSKQQRPCGKYDVIALTVSEDRSAQNTKTLEACGLPAKFVYKEGQEIKFARVKYDKEAKIFRTASYSQVEKLSNL